MSFIKGERTLRRKLNLCITSNKEPRTRLKITSVVIYRLRIKLRITLIETKARTKPNITLIVTVTVTVTAIIDTISVATAVIAVIVVAIVEITNIKANTTVLIVGKAINCVEAIS
jgi:hypothetical protein